MMVLFAVDIDATHNRYAIRCATMPRYVRYAVVRFIADKSLRLIEHAMPSLMLQMLACLTICRRRYKTSMTSLMSIQRII